MLDLARRCGRHCPDAWLINFTNPAGMVTEALVPGAGEPGDRASAIPPAAWSSGRPGLRERTCRTGRLDGVGYFGLNHLGWLYRLESGGRDLLPGLLSDPAALETFEEGRLFDAALPGRARLPAQRIPLLLLPARRRPACHAGDAANPRRVHPRQQQDLYPRLAGAGTDAFRLWDAARRSREEGYLAEARPDGKQRDEDDLAGGGYERVALAVMRALSGAAGRS